MGSFLALGFRGSPFSELPCFTCPGQVLRFSSRGEMFSFISWHRDEVYALSSWLLRGILLSACPNEVLRFVGCTQVLHFYQGLRCLACPHGVTVRRLPHPLGLVEEFFFPSYLVYNPSDVPSRALVACICLPFFGRRILDHAFVMILLIPITCFSFFGSLPEPKLADNQPRYHSCCAESVAERIGRTCTGLCPVETCSRGGA